MLPGSSLTLLATLQKKESNVTVNYGPGTKVIKFIQVCYCMRTQNHIATRKNLINTPQWKVDTKLISHIMRLFQESASSRTVLFFILAQVGEVSKCIIFAYN